MLNNINTVKMRYTIISFYPLKSGFFLLYFFLLLLVKACCFIFGK